MPTTRRKKRPVCVLTDFADRAWSEIGKPGGRGVISASKEHGTGVFADGTPFRVFVCRQEGDERQLRGHEFSEIVIFGSPTAEAVEEAESHKK